MSFAVTHRAMAGSLAWRAAGARGAGGVPGPALEAELNQPHGVTIGPGGLLYIVDSSNHRVLRLEN